MKLPLLITVLAIAAGLPAAGSARMDARPATATELSKIRREVITYLRTVSSDPRSGTAKGIRIAVYPVCISTADRRFALAIVWPYTGDPAGVAQAGLVYASRVAGDWRVLGSLLTASTGGNRPIGLPVRPHRDLFRSAACARDPQSINELIQTGKLKTFRI
jgi:hypothetical protein